MSRMFEKLEGRQLLYGTVPTVTGTYTGTFAAISTTYTVTLDVSSQVGKHIYGTLDVTTSGGAERVFDIVGKVNANDLFRFHAINVVGSHYVTEHGELSSDLTEVTGDFAVFAKKLGNTSGTSTLSLNNT